MWFFIGGVLYRFKLFFSFIDLVRQINIRRWFPIGYFIWWLLYRSVCWTILKIFNGFFVEKYKNIDFFHSKNLWANFRDSIQSFEPPYCLVITKNDQELCFFHPDSFQSNSNIKDLTRSNKDCSFIEIKYYLNQYKCNSHFSEILKHNVSKTALTLNRAILFYKNKFCFINIFLSSFFE